MAGIVKANIDSIDGKLNDIMLNPLGRLLANLEVNTRILNITQDPFNGAVIFTFSNPNYIEGEHVLEVQANGEEYQHNEQTFFVDSYDPEYNSFTLESNSGDYDSSY